VKCQSRVNRGAGGGDNFLVGSLSGTSPRDSGSPELSLSVYHGNSAENRSDVNSFGGLPFCAHTTNCYMRFFTVGDCSVERWNDEPT
jgi:hypothetical protein